jgi:hypothetical protein
MTIALCCRVCRRSGELDYERKGWWTDWFGRARRLERSEVFLQLDPSARETKKSLYEMCLLPHL